MRWKGVRQPANDALSTHRTRVLTARKNRGAPRSRQGDPSAAELARNALPTKDLSKAATSPDGTSAILSPSRSQDLVDRPADKQRVGHPETVERQEGLDAVEAL